jgi:hypothetical protein
MPLAVTLANQFNLRIRERGFVYFRQKRVLVSDGNGTELGAKVRGSELYEVMPRWTGTELAVLCDCIYFLENARPCKHLWAAVLAADAGQYLAEASAIPAPRLDVDELLFAADYVFILDPWWNPAVEAQAVDRAHRIGQVRQVFAYRLIARDTVEEKVLQLQETKRHLADAILGAGNSLIRELRVEDIELLLS